MRRWAEKWLKKLRGAEGMEKMLRGAEGMENRVNEAGEGGGGGVSEMAEECGYASCWYWLILLAFPSYFPFKFFFNLFSLPASSIF